MKQRYVINIKNVDDLDDLEIEMSPFTIFIGDNNSGKSVIMNIVYGLSRLGSEIIDKADKTSNEYLLCMDFIKKLKHNKEGCIDGQIGNLFCNFFNVSLLQNKEYFFNKIFNVSIENNYKRFENSQIFLSGYKIFPKIYLALDSLCDEIIIEGDFVKIPEKFFDDEDYLLKFICYKIIDDGFCDVCASKPIFIPSFRSTFLCYPDIFDNLKYQNLSIEDFIKNIKKLEITENSVYSNIHKFIEDEVINGNLKKDSYKSYLNDIEIPINIASDSVRELASLVLFLKSKDRYTSFFIEEIETHLNLKMQRSVVSSIIRIINAGTRIFMSTNSNVVLDQICNFLLLNNLNRSKITGFGYIINDILNVDDINIYEFIYKNKKVLVNKIDITYNGFKINSNDEILGKIVDENIQLRIEMFENNK